MRARSTPPRLRRHGALRPVGAPVPLSGRYAIQGAQVRTGLELWADYAGVPLLLEDTRATLRELPISTPSFPPMAAASSLALTAATRPASLRKPRPARCSGTTAPPPTMSSACRRLFRSARRRAATSSRWDVPSQLCAPPPRSHSSPLAVPSPALLGKASSRQRPRSDSRSSLASPSPMTSRVSPRAAPTRFSPAARSRRNSRSCAH